MSVFFAPTIRSAALAPALRSFDRGFERFLSDALFAPTQPTAYFKEDAEAWTLSLDVPGVDRKELSIGVEGQVVRIETAADARRPYKLAYELSEEIDPELTEARLENGVLTLRLAKKKPVSKVRTIEVK